MLKVVLAIRSTGLSSPGMMVADKAQLQNQDRSVAPEFACQYDSEPAAC